MVQFEPDSRRLCRPGPYPFGTSLKFKLSPGDAGTDETIALMIAAIHSTDATRYVSELAKLIREEAGSHADENAEARQTLALYYVHWFLLNTFRFRADPTDAAGRPIEFVQHPDQLIAQIAEAGMVEGDCDDLAVLGAALVRELGRVYGWGAALITVARQPGGPFEHVIYGAVIDGTIVPFDPQERIEPGQWPTRPYGRVRVYPIP